MKNRDPAILEEELKKILSEVKYQDQLFKNVMMTTWDLNSRKAYVVTKQNYIEKETMPF